MTRRRAIRECLIMVGLALAIYHAGKAIVGSIERQFYLHHQSVALRSGQAQAEEVNQELRDGLANYRSTSGIERLARERLNLAGPDEVIVRIGR